MGLASRFNSGQTGGAPQQQQSGPPPSQGAGQYSYPQIQQSWQQPTQQYQQPQQGGQQSGHPQQGFQASGYQQQSYQPSGYQQPAYQQGYQAPPQPWQQNTQPAQGYQQQPQQQTSAAPSGGLNDQGLQTVLHNQLNNIIKVNRLEAFYPPQRLQQVKDHVARVDFRALAQKWKMPVELALDLVALALYDIVIYADDSTSMKYAENGSRIDDMKVVLERVTEVATLFDSDGELQPYSSDYMTKACRDLCSWTTAPTVISMLCQHMRSLVPFLTQKAVCVDAGISVRFMNANLQRDNIRDSLSAANLVARCQFSGMTPLGTQMYARILKPLVEAPISNRTMQKPVLVITITDGEPTSEPESKIVKVIKSIKAFAAKSQYGPGAVAFEFAQKLHVSVTSAHLAHSTLIVVVVRTQVGKDTDAQAFLGRLDNDRDVGSMIDATSYFELEAEEYQRRGVVLTPELWMVKLMVGAIDPTYDEQVSR
ncbi:hypothetical protein MMC14_009504 [Varicellaria rhodocarpa]|nr:hypothetical protein [Varicellaria rhodocarpa]